MLPMLRLVSSQLFAVRRALGVAFRGRHDHDARVRQLARAARPVACYNLHVCMYICTPECGLSCHTPNPSSRPSPRSPHVHPVTHALRRPRRQSQPISYRVDAWDFHVPFPSLWLLWLFLSLHRADAKPPMHRDLLSLVLPLLTAPAALPLPFARLCTMAHLAHSMSLATAERANQAI